MDSIEQCFSVFDVFDRNSLDKKSVEWALKAQGISIAPRELDNVVERCGGSVKLDQFRHLVKTKSQQTDSLEDAQRLFRLFDLNQTGRVTLDNLRTVSQRTGFKSSDQTLRAVMRYADMDGDGEISLGDWRYAMGRVDRDDARTEKRDLTTRGLTTAQLRPPSDWDNSMNASFEGSNGLLLSKYEDVQVPNRFNGISDFILGKAAAWGEKPAFIDSTGGRSITFSKLRDLVKRISGSLVKIGAKPGMVVGIVLPNLPEYAAVFHAVASIGCISALFRDTTPEATLASQFDTACVSYLFTTSALSEKCKRAASGKGVKEVFAIGELVQGTTPFTQILRQSPDAPETEIHPDSTATMVFSSGTTGAPRCIKLTHKALIYNIQQHSAMDPDSLRPDDTNLAVLQFSQLFSLQYILNLPLKMGVTTITMHKFDLQVMLEIIESYKVTNLHVVPPIAIAMAKHPMVDRYNLNSLRLVTCAASSLIKEIEVEVHQRIRCKIRQAYCLSELGVCTLNPLRSLQPGSVGMLLPNCEAKILDLRTGQSLGCGSMGELCIKTPSQTSGYLPSEGAQIRMPLDEDGFFHTGDVGRVDRTGYYYIVGRVEDIYEYHGQSVCPSEIESALLTHPEVSDCAVVGVEVQTVQGRNLISPMAFLALKPTSTLDANNVAEWLSHHFPDSNAHRVERVVFVEAIPKSQSGTTNRTALLRRV